MFQLYARPGRARNVVRWKIDPRFIGAAFPKKKRVRNSPKKATEPEAAVQARAEEYLMARNVAFIRLPDALWRSIIAAKDIPIWTKKSISDYLKGLPDLIIFHPKDLGRVKCIEIKTEVGKLSAAQSTWQDKIGTVVCYGWTETRKEIDGFLDDIT